MNIIKIVSVIICTIIGAGFASGKEIYTFFARFGVNGVLGIGISLVFTGVIIYFSLKLIIKNKVKNNEELIKKIKAPAGFYYIINIFLAISFYVMFTGFCAYFKQEFKIPLLVTGIVLSILLYMVLTKKIECIIKLNTIMAPFLIIIITFICVKECMKKNINIEQTENLLQSIIYALLYSSCNSIILLPILITIRKYIKSAKEILIISIVSTIIIGFLALIICIVLQSKDVANLDLPIIAITPNKVEKYIYGLVIEIAIFTSAVSAGFGILENVKTKNLKQITAFMCLGGILISRIGFGNLVEILYPILGAIGIVELILILKNAKEY